MDFEVCPIGTYRLLHCLGYRLNAAQDGWEAGGDDLAEPAGSTRGDEGGRIVVDLEEGS
jgi:hypothetical protein